MSFHITRGMRICIKCDAEIGSERVCCHLCHRRFCIHSTMINDKAVCKECEQPRKENAA